MESSRRFSLILIPILALGLLLFRACKNGNTLSEEDKAELLMEADSLQQAIESRWISLLQADDQMQYNLNSLVQVLAAEEVINEPLSDSLTQAVNALGPLRREMESMKSETITAYDDVWLELSAQLMDLPGEEPSVATVGILEALNQFINNDVLSLRVAYDQSARAYNQWYVEHGEKLVDSSLRAKYLLFSLE
ncbi:MAG TPA: hypothetical protein DCE41_04805 [Cytophagales bacterium]|nr:hypothetical protein [Cytophagales bacterium]HAA22503.1 hypothetical protein [Cytophagales bacterium]HAP62154.1 hypothetical protein [Cytophagales bacterium]